MASSTLHKLRKWKTPLFLLTVGLATYLIFDFFTVPWAVKDVLYGRSNVPVTLCSLVPEWYSTPYVDKPDFPRLHDNPVLGKVRLSPEEARQVFPGSVEKLDFSDTGSACLYQPRHAVVFDKGGVHYEVLLCFTCGHMTIYRNGWSSKWTFYGNPKALNALYEARSIPIFKD